MSASGGDQVQSPRSKVQSLGGNCNAEPDRRRHGASRTRTTNGKPDVTI